MPGEPPPDGPPAAGIDERMAERRRQVRRERRGRRRRRMLVAVVVLAVLATLVVIERSPLVGLERVEVVGTERLTDDEVRERAELELGTSTLRLRLGAVEDRVRALPLVRTVTARRLDPLTVRIEVDERLPALRVRGSDGEVMVDRDGVVLAPTDGAVDVPDGLVPVRVDDALPPPGERPETGSPLDAAVRTWRGLSGPLRVEVESLRVDRAGEVELTLLAGTEVRLGTAERLDEKVRSLGAVLEDLEGAAVRAIDVTAPGRPAVEP